MAQVFEQVAGTNGFTTSPLTLQSTELNSLANGNTATSSVGGSSGVFTQSSIGNAQKGSIWFAAGGAVTPTGSPTLSCWFLKSTDGGTTFEKDVSNTAQPRAPDFTVPLFASAYSSGQVSYAGQAYVLFPAEPWKLKVQNNSGVTLPSSGNTIVTGPTKYQAN